MRREDLALLLGRLDSIVHLRNLAEGWSIDEVLDFNCSDELLAAIDKLVETSLDDGPAHFGYVLPVDIAASIPGRGDIWDRVREYCRKRLGEDYLTPHHLVEVFLCVFQLEDAGAFIDHDVVGRLEPGLLFDKAGLLVGPADAISFTKEGVLTSKYWLQTDSHLPGGYQLGGFVDQLIRVKAQLDEPATHFGILVRRDTVAERRYHRPISTRAYIRGPKGISAEMLNDPGFPEQASGTVTEHRRTGHHEQQSILALDRIEVMWSARGGIKTVQIEELKQPLARDLLMPDVVPNRYVHSRWDPETGRMVHFDGAIRFYRKDQYGHRLTTDLRKMSEKAEVYKKLFRIDAPLTLEVWCDLVARFFVDNELVLEYLGGPAE